MSVGYYLKIESNVKNLKEMQKIIQQCEEIGIEPPEEIIERCKEHSHLAEVRYDYFDIDECDRRTNHALKAFDDSDCEGGEKGFVIDLKKLPKHIEFLRVSFSVSI